MRRTISYVLSKYILRPKNKPVLSKVRMVPSNMNGFVWEGYIDIINHRQRVCEECLKLAISISLNLYMSKLVQSRELNLIEIIRRVGIHDNDKRAQ